MKRLFTISALLLTIAVGSYGENEQKQYLPTTGKVAIGIDFAPVLSYLGNSLNGTVGNGLDEFGGRPPIILNDVNHNPDVSILAKYMLAKNLALRANVSLLNRSNTFREYVQDDKRHFLDPLSEDKLVDNVKLNDSGVALSVGMEFRRGSNRIQGFLGGNILFGVESKSLQSKYANSISEINQTPTRVNVTRQNYPSYVTNIAQPNYWTNSYVVSEYGSGNSIVYGISANTGVECFIFPYVSIGGEVHISALWRNGAQRYQEREGFNTLTNSVEKRTELISPGNRSFSLGTENLGGALFMMFYF